MPLKPLLRHEHNIVTNLQQLLGCEPSEIESTVLALQGEARTLRKDLEKLTLASGALTISELAEGAETIGKVRVVAHQIEASSVNLLKDLADLLRKALGSGVGLLAAVLEDKVMLVCVVTDDLVKTKRFHAGNLIKEVAAVIGGSGGGKPHMATAGGKDIEKIDAVLAEFTRLVTHGSGNANE